AVRPACRIQACRRAEFGSDAHHQFPGQISVCRLAKGFETSLGLAPTTVILAVSVVPRPSASSLVRWGTFLGSQVMTRASVVSTATAFRPARMRRMFLIDAP